VLDYKTPFDLANHIIFLDSNMDAYNRYFEWKKFVKFNQFDQISFAAIANTEPQSISSFCDMCIALHLEDYYGIKQSIINETGPKFWSEESNCLEPDYF